MEKHIKHGFLFTFIVGVLWTGWLFGYALGPDPGVNGIFGPANTCAQSGCHVSNALNSGTGSVTVTGLPANWTPGQVYPLTVTVRGSRAMVYGFQFSAVRNSNNAQAGTLTLNSSSSRVFIRPGGGIQYAQHNLPISSGVFTFDWTAPADAIPGTVRFNVAGNSANGDGTNFNDFIYAQAYTADPVAAPAPLSETIYYPHVVNGVLGATVWKTTILLTNPAPIGTPPASGSITFTLENSTTLSAGGSPFALVLSDETGQVLPSSSTAAFQIAGGETRKFTSSGTGAFAGGFATVGSDLPVAGTAIFSEFDTAGHLITEAGVPAARAVTNQAIFVDTQGGYNIGVAYANPGTSTANVTLQLLNSSGVLVNSTTVPLGPGNHDARFTFQLFTPAPPPLTGTMLISSDSPLAAIALRTDPSFALYTTLPPVTLASVFLDLLSPMPRLQQIAASFIARLSARIDRRLAGELQAHSWMPLGPGKPLIDTRSRTTSSSRR